MEGQAFIETDEDECILPTGFFEEDDNVRKTTDLDYRNRNIKNELNYTREEVS